MSIKASNIRNIAIIGHSGEGKTTLTEAILYNGGSIDRMGKTDNGTTVSDFDEQEIARKMSISLALSYTTWKENKLNLIDVPGFYDFDAEFNQAMRACGGAIVVMGATGSLTVGTEKSISACIKSHKPMVIFINGMDKDNANYHATLESLKEKYPNKIAPIQIPIMQGNKMVGYVNTLTNKAYKFEKNGRTECPIPSSLSDEITESIMALTEAAAENDDALLEKYFDEGELSPAEIILGIKKGIRNLSVIPVMAGSALMNMGVINLMDEAIKYMPEAAERTLKATIPDTDNKVTVECNMDEPFAAQVFKTAVDAFVGKMNYIRVCRGVLKPGMSVLNATTGQLERINAVYSVKGKKTESVSELVAGDIGAVSKLNNTNTGDTLCDENNPVMFSAINYPHPVLYQAIYAKVKGTEDKIFGGLNKIMDEDKGFAVIKDKETGETLIGGQGDIHLDIIAKKLKAKFGADADLRTPQINYKETIMGKAEAEGKYKKQSGGHGQYGHCKMRFEPCESDFEFAEEVVGGSVPKQYIPAVEKGIMECLPHGVLAGFPVIKMKAILYDGSYHDVDSSEAAFKSAAYIAFNEGMKKAKPCLLEPYQKVTVSIPEQYLGDVLGDLNKRRGRILSMEAVEDMQIVTAEAPKSEILTYATSLRAITQGRGKFEEAFERYEVAPESVLASLKK